MSSAGGGVVCGAGLAAKPATTHSQQVALPRQRGMVIADPAAAGFHLQHITLPAWAAYWLPFEADHGTHRLQPGTRFEDVLKLCVFDRELRPLVPDAIERVEESVRSLPPDAPAAARRRSCATLSATPHPGSACACGFVGTIARPSIGGCAA